MNKKISLVLRIFFTVQRTVFTHQSHPNILCSQLSFRNPEKNFASEGSFWDSSKSTLFVVVVCLVLGGKFVLDFFVVVLVRFVLFVCLFFCLVLPATGFAWKGLGSPNTASVTHQAKGIHSTVNPWDSYIHTTINDKCIKGGKRIMKYMEVSLPQKGERLRLSLF